LLTRPGLLGRIGGTSTGSALSPLFAASILELTNKFGIGSYPSAIRNSTGTFKMYDSVAGSILKTAQINEHRVNGCREVVNQCQFSEDLTNGVYTKKGVTITPNAIMAPDGTVSADLVIEDNSNGLHRVYQISHGLTVGSTYMISRYIKKRDRDWYWFNLNGINSGIAWFNVSTGLWGTVQSSVIDYSAKDCGNGWWRLFITGVATSTSIGNGGSWTTGDGVLSFPGDGLSGGYDWGVSINDVTGLDPNYVPEYVPNLGTGTARKLFDTTNGNTVLNNVVTEAAGVSLHPKKVIDGADWYLTKPDWKAGTAYAAGAEVNNGGKWYSTVAGGTDTATFGDTVTWVEQGIYSGIGLLDEGSATQYSRQDIANWTFVGATSGGGNLVNEGTANIQHDIYDNNNAITGNVIQWCKVKATIGSPIIQFRPLGLGNGAAFASFDLSTNAIVGSGGSAYVTSRISAPDSNGYVICEMVANYASAPSGSMIGFTNNGAAELPAYTGAGSQIDVAWVQTEGGTVRTSEIPNTSASPVTRANEMGNIKWDSSFFPQAKGTMALTWVPQFTPAEHGSNTSSIITLSNSLVDFLHQGWTTQIKVKDGTNATVTNMPAWSRNDAIEMIVDWDDSIPQMSLHYRNASNGDAWTHVPPVPYDGMFANTGFLQLLKSGGGNNSAFRNIPRVYGTTFTNTELEAKFQ